MAVTKTSPGFQIDGRVSIALDALDDKQKSAVGGVLTDRAHFVASTSDSRKVRRISKIHPYYALSVPSGLRVIYSKVGDDIVVMDLMRQATLDTLGQRKAAKPKRNGAKKAGTLSHATKAKSAPPRRQG
jgi:hypothetical protein